MLEYAQYHGRCASNKYLVDRMDVKGMIKALRNGDALWYAPDHDYGSHASVFVPYFAVEQAATITGTATLARVKNTVTLPCYNIRTSEGYTLHIGAPLADYPSGDDMVDAARANREIEAAVRKAPEQYMWLHRRFRPAPPPRMPASTKPQPRQGSDRKNRQTACWRFVFICYQPCAANKICRSIASFMLAPIPINQQQKRPHRRP